METYFIEKHNFIKNSISFLAKHANNLRGLGLNKEKNLIASLQALSEQIKLLPNIEKESCKSALFSLQKELNQSLESRIQKRYINLGNFVKQTLQNRYSEFFENFNLLIKNKEGHIEYLQQLFAHKLSKDFHLPNLSNSVDKMRNMAKLRLEVKAILSTFDLSIIFLEKGVLNKITSLDFKHASLDSNLQTTNDYIEKLISEIASKCSAFQHELIYNKLPLQKKLSHFHEKIQNEITTQVNTRTSLTKMLYSMAKGQKNEYGCLKKLNSLIEENDKN
jgi:hypothetical protein